MKFHLLSRCAIAFVCSSLPVTTAFAQCANQWLPGGGASGPNGVVSDACSWDPDGPGPASDRIVMVGNFNQVGALSAVNVAALDPISRTWQSFGAGLTGSAHCVEVMTNGDLVVGGIHLVGWGTPSESNVARWDGSSWQALSNGPNAEVVASCTLPNGDLVVGGNFLLCGSTVVNRVARWDGSQWHPLGTGTDGMVYELTALPNGDVVASGSFSTAGGTQVGHIARWDGTNWHPLGNGTDSWVLAAVSLPNGDLLVAGAFGQAGGLASPNVARWNGTNWSSLGDPGCSVTTAAVTASGEILISGQVSQGLPSAGFWVVKRWNGSTWDVVADPNRLFAIVCLVPLPNGECFAGGHIPSIHGVVAGGGALWNGSTWRPLEHGLRPVVFAVAPSHRTRSPIVATGGNNNSRVRAARGIASGWEDLGSPEGQLAPWSDAYAVTEMGDGSIVIGGIFLNELGGSGIARRTPGGSWSTMGSGMNGAVYALARLANGDIVAGGNFTSAGGVPANRVARWDGTTWHPMGSGMNTDVYALTFVPNDENPFGGVLYAGGLFTMADGNPATHVAAWYGTSWLGISGGMNDSVNALCHTPNGDLIAGGSFTTASGAPAARVAKWNGGAWQACGSGTSGPVFAVTALPNGDFLAGGAFVSAGGTTVNNIARWNGSSWLGLGTGADASVMALATMPDGDVWAGGYFTTVDNQSSLHVARITTTCPATAMPFLSGCPSSGGNNTLAATTLPWADATFVATGTGLPTTALALTLTSVTSFPQGAVPLLLAFAEAGPGCDVLVAPDILGALVTTTGTATSSFFLPDSPPIVGVTFYHQLVPFDLGSGAITATNALQLTAGQF